MAGIKKNSERVYSIDLVANVAKSLNLNDGTLPNIIQMFNRGNGNVYMSSKRNPTTTYFDKQSAPYAPSVATFPSGIDIIYIMSDVTCSVEVHTFESDEIYSSDLDKTQQTNIMENSFFNNYTDSIKSVTPHVYNITCTNANTEYSQLLPDTTKKFCIGVRDGLSTDNFRFAFSTGKVATPTAPYMKYPQDVEYSEVDLALVGQTIYFGSSFAGRVIQILAWT